MDQVRNQGKTYGSWNKQLMQTDALINEGDKVEGDSS